jgi:hypothetical protein
MWVLVILAVNANMAFSIPGYSSEQTCSAKGKEIIAIIPRKKGGNWVYHCVKPEWRSPRSQGCPLADDRTGVSPW